MANQASEKFISPESSNCSGIISMNANGSVLQASSPSRVSNGSVGILWDIENCPVPSDVWPEDVAGNIRMALRVHPVITGAVTLFSAYGDFNAFPRRLREGCQRTGVKLVDVPNGRKDAADKAILVDMFLFALDNPPPSSILLISGDVDFAPALHILGQRGYSIILVLPARVDVSSALSSAGRFVWDWPSVARGVGFVPPRSFMSCGPTVAGYLMGCHLRESSVGQNEDEAIIYTGNSHHEYTARVNINQANCFNSSHVSREPSRCIHSMSEHCGNNLTGMPSVPSKSQSLSCGLREAPTVDQTQMQDEVMWVQPGDIYGLKGQIMKLLEIFSGSLPLVRLPPEYLKRYGRPLYVAEYGALKLVNLIKKLGSPLCIVGKGHYKMVCLRNTVDRQERVGTCTPALAGKGRKGKEAAEDNSVDIGVCPTMGSSSDDFSEDEKIDIVEASSMGAGPVSDYNQCLESFRHEMQDLLVCLSYCVPLSEFESSYEQRYKKSIDYQLFGVDGLEDLIKKVSDVVVLCQEQETKVKYLVSRLPAL